MAIRMIVVDLDGTLLNSQNEVSPRNIQALRSAAARGVEILPCTGRVQGESIFVCEALQVCRYLATCNGSLIYDLQQKKQLQCTSMSLETALQLIDILERNEVFYQIYGVNDSYCSHRSMQRIDHSGVIQSYIDAYRDTQILFDDFTQLAKRDGVVALKFFASSTDIPTITRVRHEIDQVPGIRTTSSLPHNIEILCDGIDKFTAIAQFAKTLGIAPQEMMALGDSENDINLVQHAGIGVAMENGVPEIKQVADFVAPSNNADGVAVAVERFLLQ